MMNSPFMIQQAKTFVALLDAKTKDSTQKIEQAYRMLYGRLPTAEEAKVGLAYVAKEEDSNNASARWQQYAQVLLSSNEFMHIE